MNREEAIRQIARAGIATEAVDGVSKIHARASQDYEAIRLDQTRTESWTRGEMAKAYLRTKRAVDDFLVSMAKKVVDQDKADAEKVFGLKGIPGDPASLVISRRDALDRVERVDSAEDLHSLLLRATRSGDEVLARTVAERATELGYVDTMQKFLDDRPNLDSAGERLWHAQQRGDSDTMMLSFQTMAGKPQELANTAEFQIEHLAREAATR